jgi:tetratricopeptide (TPR) repeat protein
VIAFLTWTAWIQTSYWRESELLWKHTLAVTGNNETAHSLLGDLAVEKGLIDEAAAHYQVAANVWPSSPTFQAKLGKALLRKDLNDEAIVHFQTAIELASHRTDTERAELQSDIGNELLQKGLVDEAIVQFRQALELVPTDRIIHNDYGNALLRKGLVDAAIVQFQKALDSGVEDAYAPSIHYNLGNALRKKKLLGAAVAQYRDALKRDPRLVAAQDNLAWILATASDASLRNGSQALQLATQANQFSGGRDPVILRTLAAAYAENGQFSQALQTAKSASELAAIQGNRALVKALQNEMTSYQTGSPHHEP